MGRRAAVRRTSRASSAPDCCSRCGCRAARPRYASRGGWPARGWRRRSTSRCARRDQLARQVEQRSWEQVSRLAVSGLSSPLTTSAGRLFDAVAALCGLRSEVNYEGQAAVELEAACDLGEQHAYELPLLDDGGPLVIDARPMVRAVVGDLDARVDGRQDRGALPQRAGRGHGERVRARGRAPDDRPGGALGRRVPEPAAARADRVAARATPGCGCSRRSGCPRTTAGSPTGSSPWRPRAWRRREEAPMFGLDDWVAELAHGEALVGGARRGPAARPPARLRSGPPRGGVDADRLGARGRDPSRRAARARLGARARDHARPVRPADRALPCVSPRCGAARARRHSWG